MNQWSDAEQHAQRAREHFQAGQWDRALTELEAALAVNPDQHEWQFGMGLTLDALHRPKEAVRCYEAVLRLHGEDLETLLHLGADLIRIQEPARAIEVLQRANEVSPRCESAYCYRIAAHAQLGEHDEAEVMFYMAQQIDDDCPLCYQHLAQSLAMRGEVDRATWCWEQVARLDPRFPDVYANLARAHWKQGRFPQARECYLQQLRQEPGDVSLMLEMAELLASMGLQAEAVEKYRRVLEQDPKRAQAHLRLGELAMEGGHLDAAQRAFDRALTLQANLPGLHLRLAQVAMLREVPIAARLHLRKELSLKKFEQDHMLDIVRLLIDLHLPRAAAALASRHLDATGAAVGDDHYRATLLLYRGVVWMTLGRTRRGIADCRASLRLHPRNTVAMHNLVLAYMGHGQLPRARFWLRRALELTPQDEELRRLRWRLSWARVKQFVTRLADMWRH